MDYQALYQQKLTTPAEAVKVVKSGDWVDYSWCINHPVALDKALAARQNELFDVKIRGGLGALLVIAEEKQDTFDIAVWKSFIVDGEQVKADTWYMLKDGDLVEVEENA